MTPVKLNPNDDIPYLGMFDNNKPYQCNPENYINTEIILTSDEILCFEIIIAYFVNNYNQRDCINIPYLGLSRKFPGYMFYVKSYMWDTYKKTGIYTLIIYKMPNVPKEVLVKAFRTPMWIQYYSYYITSYSNYFSDYSRESIYSFNRMYNIEEMMIESERQQSGRINIIL